MTTQPSELEELMEKYKKHAYEGEVEQTIEAINKLLSTSQREALEDLKSELRDYHDKYPDADYQDIIGYITGFQKRPALTDSKGV